MKFIEQNYNNHNLSKWKISKNGHYICSKCNYIIFIIEPILSLNGIIKAIILKFPNINYSNGSDGVICKNLTFLTCEEIQIKTLLE